jgi:hypothetical protein
MTGRPLGGAAGAFASVVDATGTFIAIPGHATGFWIHCSAAAWIDVRGNNTADSLAETDAAPLAAGVLYGPFGVQRSIDKYIAVAGRGGAADVTITFVT